ncbi:hypothetical protein [Sphingomonas parva]|nr:hypothetical protein [Sphingomonas parva]
MSRKESRTEALEAEADPAEQARPVQFHFVNLRPGETVRDA